MYFFKGVLLVLDNNRSGQGPWWSGREDWDEPVKSEFIQQNLVNEKPFFNCIMNSI